MDTIKKHSNVVKKALREYKSIGNVIPKDLLETVPYIFDFTEKNKKLASIDLKNAEAFNNYITDTLRENNCTFGAGGYGEDRVIYRRSDLFENNTNPRSIHLGVDLWAEAGTSVSAPLPAVIHSFKDNNNFGDYGPTIILEHSLEGVTFFTLYGHLSGVSLEGLKEGMRIEQGKQIGRFGSYSENGEWPSHLHFEIISDMLGKKGDFPGVAIGLEKKYYLTLCPNPNLILKIGELDK